MKGNDTNVCLYEVKQEDVEVKQKMILPNLPTVPGTHKLHQIVAANEVIWNQIMDRLQQKKKLSEGTFEKQSKFLYSLIVVTMYMFRNCTILDRITYI